MRILLADDHALVRSGLRRILEDAFPDATIDETGSCEDLHRKVATSAWSVLILDIAMGDRNGLDLIPELKRARPGLPIIILSMYGERPFIVHALRAGACGYLTKDRAPEELLEAVRTVLRGKRYLGETAASHLAEYVALAGADSDLLHQSLSAREFEVFLLLAQAHSVSEIAAKLHLSVKTISTYRTRILEKMGLTSNAQIMQYAMRNGLVP